MVYLSGNHTIHIRIVYIRIVNCVYVLCIEDCVCGSEYCVYYTIRIWCI